MPHLFIYTKRCGIILSMSGKRKFDLNYIWVFLTGFLIFLASTLFSIIPTRGYWIYYGDFNVQQLPFYMHVHEAIRLGNRLYDFGTDLGGSIIGQYSFYLLGSPFFWLTIPFKTEIVPYLMPWLSALKYAVMALTAYAYCKRNLKTENGAFLAALLYSFSGFQGAVLVYNHFHDVMAFFPLYLLLFDRLQQKKKTLGFSLFTAFMVILNYYFFVGEAIFLVLYYCTRYLPQKTLIKEKIFNLLRTFLSALAGVLLSCIYLIPAIQYVLGNSRLSNTLNGYDLVAYSDSTLLLGIIKNIVMLPDVSGLNSMLNLSSSRVSGVGAYIPLFSIAGVIAFFLLNKEEKRWEKRIILISVVFAAFPILNSLFSALNSEYYARWFYMPVLMMALMTASVLENKENAAVPLKKGLKVTFIITFAITIMSVLPAKDDTGAWTVLGALKNHEQLISEIIFSFMLLFFLYIYIRFLIHKKEFVTDIVVIGACFLTTLTMFITGTLLVDNDRKEDFIVQAIEGDSPIVDFDDNFYRIETDEDFYNYPMFWEGTHSITSFISTISDSTLAFYDSQGIPRKVTSSLWTTRIGVRALLSARYYLTNDLDSIEFIGHVEDMEELKGYKLSYDNLGFKVYENENYIPMGFSFEDYITEEEYESLDTNTTAKDRLLIRALVLSDEAASELRSYLNHKDASIYQTTTLATFSGECKRRANTACTDFKTSTHGFTATSHLEEAGVLFFSVPYEEGFSAYVDGRETSIIKADYGFMVIAVPEGEHEIEFKYELSGLKQGMYLMLTGVFLLLINFIAEIRKNHLTDLQSYGKLT